MRGLQRGSRRRLLPARTHREPLAEPNLPDHVRALLRVEEGDAIAVRVPAQAAARGLGPAQDPGPIIVVPDMTTSPLTEFLRNYQA